MPEAWEHVNCRSLCLLLSSRPPTAKSSCPDSASWCTSIIGNRPREVGALGRPWRDLVVGLWGASRSFHWVCCSVWVLFHHEFHLHSWADADLHHAGPAGHSLSCTCPAEGGPAHGATQSHLYCQGKPRPALPCLDPGVVPAGFSHHSLYHVHCSGWLAVAPFYTASQAVKFLH